MKKMTIMITEEAKARPTLNTLVNKLQERLECLYGRWLDESKYEDFKDYQNNLYEFFNKIVKNENLNASSPKLTKRPFKLTFKINVVEAWIHITSSRISWGFKRTIQNS